MPVVHLVPEQDRKTPQTGIYRCPVYKVPLELSWSLSFRFPLVAYVHDGERGMTGTRELWGFYESPLTNPKRS